MKSQGTCRCGGMLVGETWPLQCRASVTLVCLTCHTRYHKHRPGLVGRQRAEDLARRLRLTLHDVPQQEAA